MRTATGLSVNFSKLSMRSRDIPSAFEQSRDLPLVCPSTFRASEGPSVNFPCIRRTFRQHKANFRAATGPFASFHVAAGYSINFPCGRGALHKVSSTFCAAEGPSSAFRAAAELSVNFRQLSLHSRVIPSTSCAVTGLSVKFHQLFVWLRNLP